MFCVYEIGKNGKPYEDGKRFFRFMHEDRFDCEVYVENHINEHPGFTRMFEIVEE